MCSTPCGINGIITRIALAEHCPKWCSTPCGINGIITIGRHAWRGCQVRCSTPCGINGIITEPDQLFSIAAMSSAQRLAASMESSLRRHARDVGLAVTCSTPCGINGIITRHAWHATSASITCSTPCGINGIITGITASIMPVMHSAQRLAASMESSQVAQRVGPCASCAQRLAASMESSLVSAGLVQCGLDVLNALRHQWNHHRSRATRCRTHLCAQRLAASMESSRWQRLATWLGDACAQRLAASMESSHAARLVTCSWHHVVLNALRHQWNHHHTLGGQMPSNALRHQGIIRQCGAFANGAQRLAASMESSLVQAGHAHVLSPCAQRLAASMESSQTSCLLRSHQQLLVLNALRHQWNHHSAHFRHSDA